MRIQDLVRQNIKDLKPYSSARDEYKGESAIQLDANENPFESGLNRYPDPYQTALKRKVSELKGVSPSNLIVGNGSDELIDLIIRAFCEPNIDRIAGLEPSYGMYEVSASINAIAYDKTCLNEDYSFSAQKLLMSVTDKTKVIFLCSPNNPTGNTLKRNEIEQVLNNFSGIVVIDEAYIDFSDKSSWINDLGEYAQLIVLQTLSKSYGLAGLRIGIGICSPEIVQILNKIKPPYNVNTMSQKLAIEGLSNQVKFKSDISQIIESREQLKKDLLSIKGILEVFESDANFLFVKMINAKKVYNYLASNRIVVRDRSNLRGCTDCLRISVGRPEENQVIIQKLKEFES